MTDELTPNERLVLDAWEPMEPPTGFAERVLVRPRTRWVPYAAAAFACGTAAAIIAVILSRPTDVVMPDAGVVSVATVDAGFVGAEIDAEQPMIVADATVAQMSDAAPAKPGTKVTVDVGETFTVHTSDGVAEIFFRGVGKCSDRMMIEVDRDDQFRAPTRWPGGVGGALVRLAVGAWAYRAHCVGRNLPGEATISGHVVVDH